MKKTIGIVIVNWNGKRYTLANLASQAEIDLGTNEIVSVVVDNASSDGTVEAIKKNYPRVAVLENATNSGFTGANNRGILYLREKKVDYLWLLNNDTTLGKDSLLALLKFATSEGIYGSKIYFAKGREYHKDRYQSQDLGRIIWYAGGLIDWDNMYASHRGVDEVDKGQFDSLQETDFITGCSMFFHRSVVEKIGMFDDTYFAYMEDVDLCLRAKRAGLGLYYVPASRVWHANAGSTSGPGNATHEYYQTRNRLLLGFRYAPLRTRIALTREAIGFLLYGSRMKKKALTDALLGRFGKGNI